MANRFLIANWKMNLPPEGIAPYLKAVAAEPAGNVRVLIAPPFPYLHQVATQTKLAVSAQNCSDREKAALTGEVAPSMIADCGAQYVIVGHSERRNLFSESDTIVARKLAAAVAAGLTPVLCIGEELRVRDSGGVATFLAAQIRAASDAGLDAARDIVVAYEPVWAIGTGRNASGIMVADTVSHIRESVERFWPPRYKDAPILYGGSVTPDNIDDLETNARIDGYLCGGASLDSGKFRAILRGMQRPSAAP